MHSQIFVNLPVKDLKKSIAFFTNLGYTFNPQFTDDNATCMILGDNLFAMLLTEKFFGSFTNKAICDTSKANQKLSLLIIGGRSFHNCSPIGKDNSGHRSQCPFWANARHDANFASVRVQSPTGRSRLNTMSAGSRRQRSLEGGRLTAGGDNPEHLNGV